MGFRRMFELGLYFLFQDYLHLNPAEITFLLSIMAFPWILKIFIAIITDNITFFDSRRRSYLILNLSVCLLALLLLMAGGLTYGKHFIMVCIVTT